MPLLLKKPRSHRYFKLSFKGLRPLGRNFVEYFVSIASRFFLFLYTYFFNKLYQLFLRFIKIFPAIFSISSIIKDFLTGKLIWSRGRLGRPIANFTIMSVAFVVFIFGELLNSSRFVVSQTVKKDYLAYTSDILPERNVALTVIPDIRRTETSAYIVSPGDSLSFIGSKFKVSVDALKYVNGLTDDSVLKVGQSISIPPVAGLVHKVSKGDTLQSIASKYRVSAQIIADFNYILDVSKLALGVELIIPDAKIPEVVQPVVVPSFLGSANASDINASKGWCMWPTTVKIITTPFSWKHNGLDIAKPWNLSDPPLYACAGGTVIRAGWDPWGLGLHVRIKHNDSYETVYGHMNRLDVKYGQTVSKGDIIGLMGSTGNSTGPHVHFIVKYKGVAQNPLDYISTSGMVNQY